MNWHVASCPWTEFHGLIQDKDGKNIMAIIDYVRDGHERDRARLIATAPELLEAAKDALDWLLPGDPGTSRALAWDRLNKIIRAAEGE